MSTRTAAEAAAETAAEVTTTHNNTQATESRTKPDVGNDDGVPTQHDSIRNNDGDHDDPPLFQFLTGMRHDLAARLPIYKSDWGRPKNIFTVLNATSFAFVIQLIPALIFAELMDRETEGNLATAEVLLSSAMIGVIYAIFAGQPIVIMGITGPVAILLGTSYSLTKKFDAEYFPFFFWICIWAGLMHIVSAMVGLVSLVWKVTPFTSQIFELFIAVIFIYDSVRSLLGPIHLNQATDNADRGAQYATLFVGLITFYIAWTLHFAEQWIYLTRHVRTFLTSYNTLVAVVIGTAVSYLPGVDQPHNGVGGMDRVSIRFSPWNWQPTADRDWVVSPFQGIDVKGIFGAIIPGFMFFLLFIIDHNVSSILTQAPKFNLQKPSAYHWDFFVLGITFIPCAILGLPPGNGLIPQAPLHCRALCTREYHWDAKTGTKKEKVTHCEEQRWSGLGQACLVFVALSAFEVIAWIPRGCLFGLFLYLGLSALHGNAVWERITLCLVTGAKRPNIPIVQNVKWSTVQLWTLIQTCCALTIFAVAQFAEVGYIYPALLSALVPFRSYILEHLFNEKDTEFLDPTNESEEEYAAELRAIHMAHRNDSFDLDDAVHFPHRADFHPKGYKKDAHNHDLLRTNIDGQVMDRLVKKNSVKFTINPSEVAIGDSNDIEVTETGTLRHNF